MSKETKQAGVQPGQREPSAVLGFLRSHPLWGYFLLAFGLQWSWMIPHYGAIINK
jgi:hypothetical protein